MLCARLPRLGAGWCFDAVDAEAELPLATPRLMWPTMAAGMTTECLIGAALLPPTLFATMAGPTAPLGGKLPPGEVELHRLAAAEDAWGGRPKNAPWSLLFTVGLGWGTKCPVVSALILLVFSDLVGMFDAVLAVLLDVILLGAYYGSVAA